MINKKISTIAGSLIIIAIVIALSFSFLNSNKKEEMQNQNNVVLNNSDLGNREEAKQEKTTENNEWRTYQIKTSDLIEFQYPKDFNVAGGGGIDGKSTQIEIKNFQWNKNGFSFPSIKYESDNRFFMQIISYTNNDLSINDWLKTKNQPAPEDIQIINEYKNLKGDIVSEKQIKIGDELGLQRIVSYKGNNGSINIIYSYANFDDKIFQLVGHFSSENYIDIYNKIISTIKFNSIN